MVIRNHDPLKQTAKLGGLLVYSDLLNPELLQRTDEFLSRHRNMDSFQNFLHRNLMAIHLSI